MDLVRVPDHDNYFYGYRILYKNLDVPNSQWAAQDIRRNVPPITKHIRSLATYTNYSFRVSAKSFKSEGLISEAFRVTTKEWGM